MRNASAEQEASKVKTSGSEKKKPNRNTSKKIFRTTLFFLKCVTRMFHVVVDYWFFFFLQFLLPSPFSIARYLFFVWVNYKYINESFAFSPG